MAARSLCPGLSRVATMTPEQSRRLSHYFNANADKPDRDRMATIVLPAHCSDAYGSALQLAVPVQIIAPALVQVIRREGPAVVLQFPRRRLPRQRAGEHADLLRQVRALAQIADAAGGHHVLPRRAA